MGRRGTTMPPTRLLALPRLSAPSALTRITSCSVDTERLTTTTIAPASRGTSLIAGGRTLPTIAATTAPCPRTDMQAASEEIGHHDETTREVRGAAKMINGLNFRRRKYVSM